MYKENPTFTKQNPFIRKCVYALSHVNLESDIRSRCIGGNNEISEAICNLIIRGEKIGTFSLPWLHQKYPNTQSQIGEFIVQTNYDGVPRALVQVISLKILFFGEIEYHFMILVLTPFVVLGLSNIKKIPDNVKFLLLMTVIFMAFISIIPVYRAYLLLPIWLIFPALSSLFFIEGIPVIQTKIRQLIQREDTKNET